MTTPTEVERQMAVQNRISTIRTLRLRYEDLLDSTVARAKLTGAGPSGRGIAELEVITDALALLEEKTDEMV
jgi:hypothetical protein